MTCSGSVYHERSGRCLARGVRVARSLWARLRGAIPTRPGTNEAILIPHARWVHSMGMRGAIDVLYLDRGFRVVRVVRGLRPWRIAPPAWRAYYALELAAGFSEGINRGDVLVWSAASQTVMDRSPRSASPSHFPRIPAR